MRDTWGVISGFGEFFYDDLKKWMDAVGFLSVSGFVIFKPDRGTEEYR